MTEVQDLYHKVKQHYSAASNDVDFDTHKRIAEAFGYSGDDLNSVPSEANLGLSCGNPLAIGSIQEGETVLDLGCGAGFDVFQAANKVGSSGKVIGVDNNEDMLAKAERVKAKHDKFNCDFRFSNITKVEVESSSVDCVISNCVVNLVPAEDKHLVFKEIYRVLKPSGRVAISDVLAKQPLPPKVRDNLALYVGCISGAGLVEDYHKFLRDAGFKTIEITDSGNDLNIFRFSTEPDESSSNTKSCFCGVNPEGVNKAGLKNKSADDDINKVDFNEFAGSFKIFAVKD